MAAPLPLAAALDWLEGLLPVLFLIVWVVSQIRMLFARGDRGRAARPEAVRPAPRPAPRPPAGDDDAQRELARQIEEFLRKPGGREARREPPRASGREAERPRPRRTTTPEPPPRPRAAKPGPPTTAARSPAAVTPPREQPQPALGSLGGHATDVARHVRDAFAHEIDHLPAGLGQPAAAAATVKAAQHGAADLVSLLRDPVTLRQLVIMREVLDRPVERW
jgi:hypothetical protein